MTSYHFCHILFVRRESVNPVYSQGMWVQDGQKAGSTGSHCRGWPHRKVHIQTNTSDDNYNFCYRVLTICYELAMGFREGNGTPLQYSCLENPMDGGAWKAAVHGVAKSWTWLSDFTFTFHFHALEKEMATHSSVLAWRIPGTGEPGGLPSLGLHRVRHDWSDLAAAAATAMGFGPDIYHFMIPSFIQDSSDLRPWEPLRTEWYMKWIPALDMRCSNYNLL